MADERLCTLQMLTKSLRDYGLTAAWLRAEAEAARIPCLWAGDVMLFDLEAVKATLLERAATGEPSPRETPSDPPPSAPAPRASFPDVMTTAQAAEYLGVSPGTMTVWRCRGCYPSLRYFRAGRAIRYRRKDLDRWIREQTVGKDDPGEV